MIGLCSVTILVCDVFRRVGKYEQHNDHTAFSHRLSDNNTPDPPVYIPELLMNIFVKKFLLLRVRREKSLERLYWYLENLLTMMMRFCLKLKRFQGDHCVDYLLAYYGSLDPTNIIIECSPASSRQLHLQTNERYNRGQINEA